ncbi:MAG: ABC transporter substrate-binding protein, partial [Chloroflexi bacterium]|nr:ABC transporter substrate-binding protein [Chloroflexota bacterium]
MAIHIGVITTLHGAFQVLGEDSIRGVELAIAEVGGAVGGHEIRFTVEGTYGDPESTRNVTEQLLNDQQIDLVIGPLSGNEGLMMRNLSRSYPDRTFLNGASGAQNLTLPEGSPNFFSFNYNGGQSVAGLGGYAYEQLGYRRIATLGEQYSFPFAQVGTFTFEFCQAGGSIVRKFWVPVMSYDFSEMIAALPEDIDALFVALGGMDAIEFLKQMADSGHQLPIIGGAISADQSVLSAEGIEGDYLVGMIAGGPTADDMNREEW